MDFSGLLTYREFQLLPRGMHHAVTCVGCTSDAFCGTERRWADIIFRALSCAAFASAALGGRNASACAVDVLCPLERFLLDASLFRGFATSAILL